MHLSQLVSIGLFTIAVWLTISAWFDRIRGTNAILEESFANPDISELSLQNLDIEGLKKANEPVPTDKDAVQAHQTLLRYIRNDFSKGIKFVMDIGNRFYGDNLPLRPDLDVRTLMNNYNSPLQVI